MKKLPSDDSFLSNARFVNFEKRDECTFDSVEYLLQSVEDDEESNELAGIDFNE